MRPLIAGCNQSTGEPLAAEDSRFKCMHSLRAEHHAECVFNKNDLFADIEFTFQKDVLCGEWVFDSDCQGYNGMVHGGILATIVDASMAQCLMGFGVVGYTTDLHFKYRKPVALHTPTRIRTRIDSVTVGLLYHLSSEILQEKKCAVTASGKFYKVES